MMPSHEDEAIAMSLEDLPANWIPTDLPGPDSPEVEPSDQLIASILQAAQEDESTHDDDTTHYDTDIPAPVLVPEPCPETPSVDEYETIEVIEDHEMMDNSDEVAYWKNQNLSDTESSNETIIPAITKAKTASPTTTTASTMIPAWKNRIAWERVSHWFPSQHQFIHDDEEEPSATPGTSSSTPMPKETTHTWSVRKMPPSRPPRRLPQPVRPKPPPPEPVPEPTPAEPVPEPTPAEPVPEPRPAEPVPEPLLPPRRPMSVPAPSEPVVVPKATGLPSQFPKIAPAAPKFITSPPPPPPPKAATSASASSSTRTNLKPNLFQTGWRAKMVFLEGELHQSGCIDWPLQYQATKTMGRQLVQESPRDH